MCGRYSLSTSSLIISEELNFSPTIQLEISFNIAPTQLAYIITNDSPNQLQQMHWGLLPEWSAVPELSGKLINARSESIFEKPSFKKAVLKRRCLVPADSFYEWRIEGKSKKPYRILPVAGGLMTMAGIWETWHNKQQKINTFSIITCEANEDVSVLHKRMPVILTGQDRGRWLSVIDAAEIKSLLNPSPSGYLRMYRISEQVNKPTFNQASVHNQVNETPTLF